MAWASFHFAVGMIGGGTLGVAATLLRPRLARYLPLAMTAGGLWACVPDLPRIFREDLPGLPLLQRLGDPQLERHLHRIGDLFFGHHALDAQPHEFALHGLILIILLYNAALLLPLFARPLRPRLRRASPATPAGRADEKCVTGK